MEIVSVVQKVLHWVQSKAVQTELWRAVWSEKMTVEKMVV